MSKNKPIKTKVALVSKFTIIIGVSIFYTVFFISAYNLYATTPIIRQYNLDKNEQFNSVSGMLNDYALKDSKENTDYEHTYNLATELVKSNLALYAGIADTKNGKYLWNTASGYFKAPANPANVVEDSEFTKKFGKIPSGNIIQGSYNVGDKVLIVAFYNENALVELVSLLIKGNLSLSMVFIIFGFCSAFILAKYVTKPIQKLVEGAAEFSGGNLKFRTDIKSEDEIGILAKSFNSMAEKLNELYNSLEQKVMDRTHELSRKNLQLKRAYKELKDTQSMVVHNEKMRSLGQLVAGVAHELNNPINFIYGNLAHLKNYTNDLIEIISKYEELESSIPEEKRKQVEDLKQELDYEFLTEDIESLIKSCMDGAERSKQIIIDLKNFSRLDEALVKEVDIHEGLESALNILNSKYKDRIEIYKQYGDIPQIMCYAGQVNQVFMNILDNSIQAIEDKGSIYIRTKLVGEFAVIEIEDTGGGIPEEVLPKIFDPFFTTKPVGEGTGLGLSICYKIIKSHNGKLEVESQKGKGTKFTIKLPTNWSEKDDSSEYSGEETTETSIANTNDADDSLS